MPSSADKQEDWGVQCKQPKYHHHHSTFLLVQCSTAESIHGQESPSRDAEFGGGLVGLTWSHTVYVYRAYGKSASPKPLEVEGL